MLTAEVKHVGSGNKTDWLSVLIAVLVGTSFLFHLIALGTTRWAGTGYEYEFKQTQRKEHIGLWKYCVDAIALSSSVEICDDFVDIIYSDWLKAAQSFMVFAFFSYLGSFVIAVLSLIPDFANNRIIVITTATLLFLTGFFQFVTLVVFGCYFQTYFDNKEPLWTDKNVGFLDWSFTLGCLSCISCLAGGAAVLTKLQDSVTSYRPIPKVQSYRPNLI